ncbi:MAG: hypothetical protein H8E41_12930 [Desulfobulbaceae bacterium]|uniref:Cytochrome c domain-containing protein n=1 Tax=Candidatus Desulfobia pelagia TaxID=2841692 RepID=A0A8J6TDI6_9BACT|nr:hypothetical protein [Candidatus Desulfobia pelagia]
MKGTKKKILSTIAVSAMLITAVGAGNAMAGDKYEGTAYVAGMGGHFAKAVFEIDPKADTPIIMKALDKIDIGDGSTHPVHDARIDYKDRDTMYWSTYKPDADANGGYHYGKSDLKTGEVLKDVGFKMPDQVINPKAGFCASAQTKDYYMPISMNKPGYISIISKKDMELKHNVFLEGTDADIGTGYKYMHGINSPDMKEVLITLNEANVAQDNKDLGVTVGKMHMMVLDAAALEQGKVKVLRKAVADGNKKSTVSFRQYYSPDGKYIANATGDILFLVDAKTLEVVDAETMPNLNETHDAIFTPDGKYIIATSRTKSVLPGCATPEKPADGEWRMDGQLKLYDVAAKTFVGKPTSTCLACHDEELGTDEDAPHAVLCGLDVNWK